MKKSIIIVLIVVGIILPLKVDALTGSVSLSCESNSINVNTSTTCTLSGYSSEEVSALTAKLSVSGNISISNISTSSVWQGNGEGGSIDLYTDSNKSGNFAIATFVVTGGSIAGTGNIIVDGVSFSDAAFSEHSIGSKTLSLIVNEVKIPEVNNNQTTNNNTDVNINNNKAPVENNNSNTTVQNNNSTENKSSDATLKSITLSNGVINFSKDVTDYNIEVSNDVENVVISALASDSKASVSIPEDLTLKLGVNDFAITVTAEDGSVKVYNLHITRLEKVLSNNSKLKSLNIAGYKISFVNDTYKYNLGNIKESSLKVTAIAEDDNAKVKVYGNDSIGKDDSIIIEVTAEDGTTSEYIIYVNNTKTSSINISFIVALGLFIISLGFNIFLIIKGKKSKSQG